MASDRRAPASAIVPWAGLAAIIAYGAAADFIPQCWPTLGAGVWLLFLLQKGLGNLSEPVIVQVCWGNSMKGFTMISSCMHKYFECDVCPGVAGNDRVVIDRSPGAGLHVLYLSIFLCYDGSSCGANVQWMD